MAGIEWLGSGGCEAEQKRIFGTVFLINILTICVFSKWNSGDKAADKYFNENFDILVQTTNCCAKN